jgi:large subunit ribosomal protein L29e
MAKRSNTSAHNRSHQHHRNGIKRARGVPLWFPKGMNRKFLRNVRAAKKGMERKAKAGGGGSEKDSTNDLTSICFLAPHRNCHSRRKR